MRGWLALGLVVTLGCQAAQLPESRETRARLSSSGYVSLPRLAVDLDLEYRGEGSGFIELSAPPNHVMFVRDSRRVLVNGTQVSMIDPCMRRGDDFILTLNDADLVRRRFAQLRAIRPAADAPEPAPPPALVVSAGPPSGLPGAWRPNAGVKPRPWRHIVIHHMAGPTGSAAYINRLHRQRGWDGLGYHFVVGNGSLSGDGQVELGYRWRQQLKGAHARARPGDDNRWNLYSIGICLVGDFTKSKPTSRQMDALVRLVRALRAEYGIPARNVVPHRFVRPTECPGSKFPWDEFQSRIR